MSYKESHKAEEIILTKFKIARMIYKEKIESKEIARRFSCHRNTICKIKKEINNHLNDNIMELLTTDKHLTYQEIKDSFNFLDNRSKVPHSNSRSLGIWDYLTVVEIFLETNYSYQCIHHLLQERGYDTKNKFTIGKIRKILRENSFLKKHVRTVNGERRALYNYDEIGSFEYLQYDTKHIADQHALPKEIYDKFKRSGIFPRYQWTIIDAKTKTRFLAWSYELSSIFGFLFLKYVISWLRSHGVQTDIHVQFDRGGEFCSGSVLKTKEWNTGLKEFNTFVYDTGGAKWKQNIVERSHRIDDEWFYCPRGIYVNTKNDFILEAQQWIINYNNRSHYGIGMKGLSPKKKLYKLGYFNAEQICNFPCLILEDFFTTLQNYLNPSCAQNVLTLYRFYGI